MIKVFDRSLGAGTSPFIIAELSGNHNQSLDRAIELVEAAARCGCDAVKLQTYTPDTLTIDSAEKDFLISNPNSPWHGRKLYELYQEAHTPWEWHEAIFKRCRELGLIPFSTPFDSTAVSLLERLEAPLYKIASFENVHLPLIREVAKTGKPIILSTGLASVAELWEAVECIRSTGNEQIVLLKCTSSYPASPEDSHLRTIPHMRELFGVEVGLSDHTLGIGAAVASVALGASVIEKHFTLRRADGGPDAAFSLEPAEMQALVRETKTAYQSLGKVSYEATERERSSAIFRRSLYVVADVEEGEPFTERNVRIIRPGYGLMPRYFDQVVGRLARRRIKRGTALTWDLLV